VIGTVRTDAETGLVDAGTADHVVSLQSGPAAAIRRLAPDGADRVVEVALSPNADLDAEVTRNGTVLAAYASPKDRRPDWGWESGRGLPNVGALTYNRLGVAGLGRRVKAIVGRRSGLTQPGNAGSSTRSGGRSRS
jgi:hypothetical protein